MTEESMLDTVSNTKFRPVCHQVVNDMRRLAVPGAVIGVAHEHAESIAAFGVTSLEHPLAVTEDALFQIGSITKTYVATAVMRLVEAGKLELDAPVRRYVPDLRLSDEAAAAGVTLRHLLTHTGGWVGDFYDDFGMGQDALARMVAKLADLPQLTPLGQVFSYNNSGFYLAGRVIEVVTGASFEAAVKELVLDPLGLGMTFFFAEDVITHRFAVGHQTENQQVSVARPWAIGRAMHPAGGITCTVKDLLRYARFHMGDGTTPDGTRLLSQESLALMQTPIVPSTGISLLGLSWSIVTVDGTKMIGHGGGTNGQVSLLRLVPSSRFAVAVVTNSDDGGALCMAAADAATDQYLGLVLPKAILLDLPEDELRPYLGRYESVASACEVGFRDGGLEMQVTPKGGFPTPDSPPPPAPPPVRMAPYAPDRFIVLDEPLKDNRGEFLRNPDNHIAWLRFYGRIHARHP